MILDAIVIAGGVPQPGEPLYPRTQGKPKALLEICGKPMVQWVLDALNESKSVGSVVFIGLEADSGIVCPKIKAWLPNAGSMVQNIRAGIDTMLAINPQAKHVLVVSSDIPALTPEGIDWVVDAAMQTDEDIYYNVIPREVMEARFPNSKRSYTHLKDIDVCGGDLNVISTSIVKEKDEFWEQMTAARKNVFKQASLIGYDTLILLLLRMITIDQAVKKVTKRIHLTGRALICPYAEIGMDVDKPHQLEIMCADLEKRMQKS